MFPVHLFPVCITPSHGNSGLNNIIKGKYGTSDVSRLEFSWIKSQGLRLMMIIIIFIIYVVLRILMVS